MPAVIVHVETTKLLKLFEISTATVIGGEELYSYLNWLHDVPFEVVLLNRPVEVGVEAVLILQIVFVITSNLRVDDCATEGERV